MEMVANILITFVTLSSSSRFYRLSLHGFPLEQNWVVPELSSLVLGLSLSRGGRGGSLKGARSGRGGGGRKGKWWKGRGKGEGRREEAEEEEVGEEEEEGVAVCKIESMENPAAQRLCWKTKDKAKIF